MTKPSKMLSRRGTTKYIKGVNLTNKNVYERSTLKKILTVGLKILYNYVNITIESEIKFELSSFEFEFEFNSNESETS